MGYHKCMYITAPVLRRASILFVIVAAFFLFSSASPQKASAAAVTLSTATTSSNNASTTLAKVGDTVSYRLVLSGTPAATSSPVINIFSMGTTSMSGSGTTWTYSTTSASTWTESAITFRMGWGGSVGEATTTITQTSLTSANVVFDKTVPTISSITSSATCTGNSGACKVGDTIAFTLATSSAERYGSVAGSYNSQSLTWSLTTNVFVGTYTVTEGNTDQSSALQISSVILSDAAGNPSSSGSGSDITATIDANTPSTAVSTPGGGTFASGVQRVTLTSTGSDSIRYTTGGANPTCTTGTLYSASTPVEIGDTLTLVTIGCDTAGNASAVASSTYTHETGSGGGGSSGGAVNIKRPIPTLSSAGGGLSGGQVQAVLDVLRSFGVDAAMIASVTKALSGSASAGAPSSPSGGYARNLQRGMLGEDVKTLQQFLNAHGFTIAPTGPGSAGNETTFFGGATRDALTQFQKAKGISPAAGYFGPKTRAAVSEAQ